VIRIDPMLKSRILDINLKYYGYSTLQLMEAAGKGIADTIDKKANDIGIFCGIGNNGGDGFVAARYLVDSNKVTVYLVGDPSSIKTDEAAHNWALLEQVAKVSRDLSIIIISDSSQLTSLKRQISSHQVIVDSMLGVGIDGEPREPICSVIRSLNSIHSKIMLKISIDIPSGYGTKISFDCSRVISMHSGKIEDKSIKCSVVDIGIPAAFDSVTGPGNVALLRRRDDASHKGDNGKVLIIAGSKRYHGACVFAGLAASKFVDLVHVVTTKDNIEIMKKAYPGFIVTSVDDFDLSRFKEFDAILVGPGLSLDNTVMRRIVKQALIAKKKIVIDAGAFDIVDPKDLHDKCILTPHHSEFKKFFGKDPEHIAEISKKGFTIVLKGHVDQIAKDGVSYRNYSGNSQMTTGGTGDVLAGMISGILAKNPCLESALGGTFLCGFAGDTMAGQPFDANDLIEKIRFASEKIKSFK